MERIHPVPKNLQMSEFNFFDVLCGIVIILFIVVGIQWYRENYSAQAFLKRGIEFVEQGKGFLANEQFDQAIHRDPQLVEAYFQRGMVFQKSFSFDQALADYGQVIDLDPNHVEAYRKRAKLFVIQEKTEEALADWNQLLILKPNYVEVYCERLNFFVKQERIQEAIRDCDQIIRIKPNFTDAYGKRAVLYLRQDNLKDALTSFDLLLDRTADDPIVYNERGLVRETLGDLVGAISDYDRAIALKPRFADALLSRGIAHAKCDNMVDARSDIDRAVTLYADSKENINIPTMYSVSMYQMAIIGFVLNEVSIAWALLSRTFERLDGTLYEIDKKDVTGALSDLNYAIELDPKLSFAYLFRWGIHQERQEHFAAWRDLLRFVRLGGLTDFYEAAKRVGDFLGPDEVDMEFFKELWGVIEELKSKLGINKKN